LTGIRASALFGGFLGHGRKWNEIRSNQKNSAKHGWPPVYTFENRSNLNYSKGEPNGAQHLCNDGQRPSADL
jgi:hypothetical protein